MITGAQMKAARALAGIDQKTLADKAGISVPTVQRMEASDDVVRATVDTLMKVIDALVLIASFALVIFRDLTTGIVVGFALGALLFIGRMARSVEVRAHVPLVPEDEPDDRNGARAAYDPASANDPDAVVYRISGAFFFGAASTVAAVLDRIADQRKGFVLDCSAIPFLDSTAANVIEGVARKAARRGVRFYVAGANRQTRRLLMSHGVKRPYARYTSSVETALARLRA